MEYTKGPWKQRSPDSVAVVDAYGNAVAYTDTFLPKEQCIANACLIAAAPELLEELKALRSFMWGEGYADQTVTMARADAAIAKAEGK